MMRDLSLSKPSFVIAKSIARPKLVFFTTFSIYYSIPSIKNRYEWSKYKSVLNWHQAGKNLSYCTREKGTYAKEYAESVFFEGEASSS